MTMKIYLVEDDAWFGELLRRHLSLNPEYEVVLFKSAKECLNNLHLKPDLITVDFGLPDISGDQLLEEIQSFDPTIPVIVISGQEDVSVAVNFLKAGAVDYIVKDENTKDLLWNSVLKVRENLSLKREVETLKEKLGEKYDFEKTIIGASPAIRQTFVLVEKAIRTNINVSIAGETGTGKEVYAKAIHYNSERRKANFVAVNMAAIPAELMESELFGYEKGAFTGAVGRKTGKFEEADGGTLFLDEIAEMDLSLQSKILRVLQEREVVRLGGNQGKKINIRLITATHRNLAEQVKKGLFREDLFYRIIGLPITLPPLRERDNDVLILAKYFADEFSRANKMNPVTFSNDAKQKLMQHAFPGNVRELKSVIELAIVMSDGNEVEADDMIFTTLGNDRVFTHAEKTLREYNIEIVSSFLKKYNNDVMEVAKKLDIGKSTIYNMIQKLEVPRT